VGKPMESAVATERVLRVGLYLRCSTSEQTTESQERDLRAWANYKGHTIVKVYEDEGVSGAKGRDKRPQFDALLKAAVSREIDMIAVWSSCRLGRKLEHLVEVLQTLKETGTQLYIHTQSLDTNTTAGRALFGMLAVFSEFEHEMIAERSAAGLSRIKEKIAKHGKFETRKGVVRTRLGRPGAAPERIEKARELLACGMGILSVAKQAGLGTGTVQKLANEMRGKVRAVA
jgi:DNA invertase Pin-like site-specific DNA recombinase